MFFFKLFHIGSEKSNRTGVSLLGNSQKRNLLPFFILAKKLTLYMSSRKDERSGGSCEHGLKHGVNV